MRRCSRCGFRMRSSGDDGRGNAPSGGFPRVLANAPILRRLSPMQQLSGILVLDFTTLLPGPLATLMLAEAGAEVVKIERPGGEDMRAMPPIHDGEAAVFALLNRGKKSLVADLKNESDRNSLAPLLEKADVLVEQFRPGVMERLGLGYEAVKALNPRIVYCSISGYGQ